MSSDGVQQPGWYGSAFPHLFHGPNFVRGSDSQNYGDLRRKPARPGLEQANGSRPSSNRAATGTWNGPAPRGLHFGSQTSREEVRISPLSEPSTVFIGSLELPLLITAAEDFETADDVTQAIELGYRGFLCSGAYPGKEEQLGKSLQGFDQDRVFFVVKVSGSCGPDAVRSSCEAILARLGRGRADLCLVELPATGDAADLPAAWAAMEQLVDSGLAEQIGLANCSLEQAELVLSGCRIRPAANEVELHPFLSQRKLVGTLFRKGVQCLAARLPAGAGLDRLLSEAEVRCVAEELGRSPLEVLLRWSIQRGIPTVVPREPGKALPSARGLLEWRLANHQKAKLDALDHQRRLLPVE